MRLRDLMKQPVYTVTPADTAAHARQLMRQHDIRHLPVVDGKDIVGLIAQRDLLLADDDLKVEIFMSRDVATLPPDATAREAANLLRGRKVGCVPVVEKGQLVGMVSEMDLLELVSRPAAAVQGHNGHDQGSAAVTHARSRGRNPPAH